jgi:hypothetical protein
MTPILLLEINEVPWRLLDHYADRPAFRNIHRFLEGSHQFTSRAVDSGELSPWVTWPTLHRGMNNEQHGIKNLGQDPSSFRGKAIWEEIREAGGSIGICGSMQSWPAKEPGQGGFYIPDTFAHDERCYPPYLNAVQAFNLAQVRKNARVVNGSMPRALEILTLGSTLARSGIRLRTGARIAAHLAHELVDKSVNVKRPVFQTVLFWDVFRKHFNALTPPQFSTFFTNHIAGVMHRYWKDVFPEDFPQQPTGDHESREWLMRFALGVLDNMLADVLQWTADNPELVVVFASSMGQAAVHREYHEGTELVVEDLALLMSRAGAAKDDYRPLLAMAPQVAVEIRDADKATKVRTTLEGAYCGERKHFISVEAIGRSLSITVSTPPLRDMASADFVIDGKRMQWSEAGIRKQEIEPGSAYHIPEGSLAVYCRRMLNEPLRKSRDLVDADRIKHWLLAINTKGCGEINSLCAA